MRLIVFIVVIVALVGVFVADGASMYGAHKNAVDFANRAAERAADTYVASGGSEDTVRTAIEGMAKGEGMHLVDLSYHKGTTRWYEVTVEAEPGGYLLKHVPYIKNHLGQRSTAIQHF